MDQNINGTRHRDKVALVTGGSSGIGLATALRLAAEGAAKVYITGRRAAELETAAMRIGEAALAIRGDIAKLDDLDRIYAQIKEESGKLDILFANAGIGEFAPLGRITEAQYDRIFGVNVKGTLFTVQKALPLMPKGSAIVINGSAVSGKGVPAFGVYAASKAALRSFVRTWAQDLKGREIRVNAVQPGTVVTGGYKGELRMTDEQIEQFKKQSALITPLERTGLPEEIAAVVSFLASSEASYVTGTEVFVDGGQAQV